MILFWSFAEFLAKFRGDPMFLPPLRNLTAIYKKQYLSAKKGKKPYLLSGFFTLIPQKEKGKLTNKSNTNNLPYHDIWLSTITNLLLHLLTHFDKSGPSMRHSPFHPQSQVAVPSDPIGHCVWAVSPASVSGQSQSRTSDAGQYFVPPSVWWASCVGLEL